MRSCSRSPQSEDASRTAPTSDPVGGRSNELDVNRIIEVFGRYGVDYLIVGGVAANLHGATRPTGDLDALPRTTSENLDRVAGALRELKAFLRVGGLTDGEARGLPVVIDGTMLSQAQISTWRTDAGDLDIMHSLPDRNGRRLEYDELAGRARAIRTDTGVVVHVAALVDVIASKEWAGRPKDHEALPELLELERSDDHDVSALLVVPVS